MNISSATIEDAAAILNLQRLADQTEAAYPAAARFELFTGLKSVNNLWFYERLGYRPFRRQPVNEKLTMVYLEKVLLPI